MASGLLNPALWSMAQSAAAAQQNPNQPKNPGLMQAIGGFANSPGGAALIQGAGGLLAGLSQNKQLEKDRALRASDSMQNAYEFETNRAKASLDADPLGATNAFAARQAFLGNLLPTLRNAQVSPTDPKIRAAMPQMTGGLRLPEGGIDPNALRAFSPEATAEAIASRQQDLMRLDPTRASASPMLNALGLNVNGVGQRLNEFQNAETNRQALQREAIRRALDNDIAGQKKKGSSIWKKIGKGALAAGLAGAGLVTGGATWSAIPTVLAMGAAGANAAVNG